MTDRLPDEQLDFARRAGGAKTFNRLPGKRRVMRGHADVPRFAGDLVNHRQKSFPRILRLMCGVRPLALDHANRQPTGHRPFGVA
jgi:hypothetical protein